MTRLVGLDWLDRCDPPLVTPGPDCTWHTTANGTLKTFCATATNELNTASDPSIACRLFLLSIVLFSGLPVDVFTVGLLIGGPAARGALGDDLTGACATRCRRIGLNNKVTSDAKPLLLSTFSALAVVASGGRLVLLFIDVWLTVDDDVLSWFLTFCNRYFQMYSDILAINIIS